LNPNRLCILKTPSAHTTFSYELSCEQKLKCPKVGLIFGAGGVTMQLPDANQREANAVFQPRDDELQSVVEATADAIAAASLQDPPSRKTTKLNSIFFSRF
jgi:hypothetical protein